MVMCKSHRVNTGKVGRVWIICYCYRSTNAYMLFYNILGTVHPKMNILSSFTHPHVVPKLYAFLCLLNTKEDIL